MNGYGAANYGVNIYGQAYYVDAAAVINAASTVTATGQRIGEASATINAVSTVTANGQKFGHASAVVEAVSTVTAAGQLVLSTSAQINAVSTVTATGAMVYSASAEIDAVSSVIANGSAIMFGSAAINAVSGMTATGRYKYEPLPIDPAVWATKPVDSATWTNLQYNANRLTNRIIAMADTTTPNYGLTKPEVGASEDTWGTKINTNLNLIDTQMKVSDDRSATNTTTANAALARSGGTMTGNIATKGITSVTLGTGNFVAGSNAGNSITSGGNYNTTIGEEAGTAITTGYNNTVVGNLAGSSITTAADNVSVGDRSLKSNTTGGSNTTIGTASLENNTTGTSNVASGWGALRANTTASNNTAIGKNALYANTTGINHTAVGSSALTANTTGNYNTALGMYVLDNNTTGSNNVAIGYGAISTSATASGQCTLGNSAITNLRCNDTSISSLSDSRDKTDVIDSPYGLDFINTVRPVQFLWDTRDGNAKDGSTRIGFLAQELLAATNGNNAVLDLVLDDNPDKLEAKYGNLLPIMVQAIQELSTQNAALAARLTALEA